MWSAPEIRFASKHCLSREAGATKFVTHVLSVLSLTERYFNSKTWNDYGGGGGGLGSLPFSSFLVNDPFVRWPKSIITMAYLYEGRGYNFHWYFLLGTREFSALVKNIDWV